MATATEERTGETGEAMTPAEGDTVSGDGSGETAEPIEPNAEKGELFDREAYKAPGLQIDKVDGEDVDKLWIPVTGRVPLDRTNPADVALFKRMRLGKEVELRISARCVKVGTGFTTSKDGDLDAVVGERTIKVTDIYALEPEELAGG